MRIFRPTVVLLLLLLTVGCRGNTDTAPSSTPTTPTIVTEAFIGSLDPSGILFYSFSVAQASQVSVMLASVTSGTGQVLSSTVTLGLGVPSGTGCGVTTSVSATPALASQITSFLGSGIYCVNVSDSAGRLSASINFSIRIVHQ